MTLLEIYNWLKEHECEIRLYMHMDNLIIEISKDNIKRMTAITEQEITSLKFPNSLFEYNAKKFVEEFNKHKVSKDFLDKCELASKLFNWDK